MEQESAAGSVTQIFAKLRQGDADSAQRLWERFFPRLLGLARKTLTGRVQRVADADDAVQSAFASFWQRAERGEFGDSLDRDEIWGLLGIITVRKARKQTRREQAEKRGGGKVVAEGQLVNREGQPLRLDELVGSMSAAEFDLHCEELLARLDEELRPLVLMRLFGYKNREIAEQLDWTERKVERKLQLVRLCWEQDWPAQE